MIDEHELDFGHPRGVPINEFDRKFPPEYRDYLVKTFESIDEKAFYLFKLVFEEDRRYAYERIEWYDNFDEYLPLITV